jgi:DNA-binding GntR family transcriptional regulator
MDSLEFTNLEHSLTQPEITASRASTREQTRARIRHGLMAGVFTPGQVLSLRKMAQALGTSLMPVRETLSQLVAAGVLEGQQNGSARVPKLSKERLHDLYEVRNLIESRASRLAAERASARLIQDLSRINKELLSSVKKRKLLECLSKNQEFHFTLYRASESEVLLPIIENVWLQSGPTLYFTLLEPGVHWDASAHSEVLDGLADKDPNAVARAISRDIRSTLKLLLTSDRWDHPGGLEGLALDGIHLS